tara:strand:- start:3 stop:533 length:531 start_codon:yes stop_codon:yes gene_type:complete
MKLYNIYEIPSFIQPDGSIGKVGCTSMTVEARALQQTHTDVILLEEHTDIYEASDREIQLQKDYGYTVDKVPYYISVKNRRIFNDVDRAKSQSILRQSYYGTEHHMTNFKKACSLGGRKGGTSPTPNKKLTNQQAFEIRSKYIPNTKGLKQKLATEYNVSYATIKGILQQPNTYLS